MPRMDEGRKDLLQLEHQNSKRCNGKNRRMAHTTGQRTSHQHGAHGKERYDDILRGLVMDEVGLGPRQQ